ncbi:MAG: hypothetical protein GX133_05395 [Syntrophomonadaceae bacterium]|nr:hypothetical protein [Syntrophomonadaceae bacterium]
MAAWDSAMNMPRARKGQGSRCVRMAADLGPPEYLHGKAEEADDPWLQILRSRKKLGLAC